MTSRQFPEGFVWGVASASYQIEGAVHEGGRGPSIWDTFSHTPGKVAHDDTGDIACDHYHRWPEDLDLIREMGIEHYRFSVSWARVIPDGVTVNPEGLDFYSRLVDGMLERGITPLLTLYHWDLPAALDQGDASGWLDRSIADKFAEYARVVGERLGDRVDSWGTLNEPWCSAYLGYGDGEHAPGRKDIRLCYPVAHHLNLAHGRGVQALRSVLPPSAQVSVTLNPMQIYPASDAPEDLAAAYHADLVANRIWFDPMFKGGYPSDLIEQTQHLTDWSFVQEGDEKVIYQPLDFLGLNYYNPTLVAAPKPVEGPKDRPVPGTDRATNIAYVGVPETDQGWPIIPSGLTDLLLRVQRDIGLPLYITENGMAAADVLEGSGAEARIKDQTRIDYLRLHAGAMLDALEQGVDLRGYFEWTLLDNFEWAWGYAKRFGLVYVDFGTQARYLKDSARWFAALAAANALEA